MQKNKKEINNFDDTDFDIKDYDEQEADTSYLKNRIKFLFEDVDEEDAIKDDATSMDYEKIKNNFELQNKVVNSFCDNISSDIKIKKRYSLCLIIVLAIQFFILDYIFLEVGLKKLEFTDFTLNLFISVGFLELVGLITIIVKYLFNDNITESLRIIMRLDDKKDK